MRKSRSFFIIFVAVLVIIFALYKLSLNFAIVREFFIERRCKQLQYVARPSRRDVAILGKCPKLLDIAVSMLRGEKIKLPFATANTRWKFKESADLRSYQRTFFRWNSPWEQGNSRETMEKARYYNVSAGSLKFRKYFITFAESCCAMSKYRALKHAMEVGGFDVATAHDMCSVNPGFRHAHGDILYRRKGSGCWLWKPYLVLKTLVEDMLHGEVLMYEDAGSYIKKDVGPLLKLANESPQGIVVFTLKLFEKYYTKSDTFRVMEINDAEFIQTSYQTMASFVVMRKDCNSLQFVMEWLAYSLDARCITDDANVLGGRNAKGFIGHRHDQSVLSLLSKKWGLLQYRNPGSSLDNFGFASGPYEQLIDHDRNRY